VGQMTEAFQLNLTALSLLALVVGMFLIYNTVMFSVVQRRAVIGTLRLLGATGARSSPSCSSRRRPPPRWARSSASGLGWLLGQGAVRLVTQTINDLYYVLSVTGAPLTALHCREGRCPRLGRASSPRWPPPSRPRASSPSRPCAAAPSRTRARRLIPKWRPRAPLSQRSAASSFSSRAARSSPASPACSPSSSASRCWPRSPRSSPWPSPPRSPGGWPARSAGSPRGRSRARSAAPASAVAALSVAIAVTIGVGLMIQSFRSTVGNWLDLTLAGRRLRGRALRRRRAELPTLSPDVLPKMEAIPGVAWVETFRSVARVEPPRRVNLAVADPRRPARHAPLSLGRGRPARCGTRRRRVA